MPYSWWYDYIRLIRKPLKLISLEYSKPFKTGFVALIGSPNVGKSTLLNYLIGQKISITSRRPQTTRHRIQGIKTTESDQIIFVDTPGIHPSAGKALNKYLNRTAYSSLAGVDVIVWLTDRLEWSASEKTIIGILENAKLPVILAINKIDRVERKDLLLPYFEEATHHYPFAKIVPVSALKRDNLDVLEKEIVALLPSQAPIYPADQISDRSERFFVSEIVREKLMRCLGQELPYRLAVEIEDFTEGPALTRIRGLIWVEKESQKPVVIGRNGRVLKEIGKRARIDIENMLDKKVHLELWVKVKRGWSNNERALQNLGYIDS